MANRLLVTPEEVNEKAKAITDIRARMEDLLSNIKQRIDTMVTEEWVGIAANTYSSQFIYLYNQVAKALDTIQTHANNLSEAANVYATDEDGQSSTIAGLDASDIF